MLILVQLDISKAEMDAFDEYETQVLALLGNHGGKILERLRSIDGKSEIHLLHFSDPNALETFRSDPDRTALQELWLKSGASSSLTEVRRLSLA
ncbi:hypothetical protein [Sphingopyxis terrae]|uniref:hypothetical protein n=1 Tax=Sphingopyxis terrae TaxID=33052 RepID=UPI0007877054|nr:hypothetical protein [Sphingopyxis terrae]